MGKNIKNNRMTKKIIILFFLSVLFLASFVYSQTEVICNPTTTYPNNGCPEDKQICASDGSYCFAQVIPKTACTSDCCLEGDPYHYPRDCPKGQDCQTNGTWTGTCTLSPDNPYCGDGICSTSIGENPLICGIDCGTGENTTDYCQNTPNASSFPTTILLLGTIFVLIVTIIFMKVKNKEVKK